MGLKHVFPYSRHYKCKATVAQFNNRLPTVHATLGTGGEGTANGASTSTPGIVADAGRNAVCSLCKLVVPGYAPPSLHKEILHVSTTHDPGPSLRTEELLQIDAPHIYLSESHSFIKIYELHLTSMPTTHHPITFYVHRTNLNSHPKISHP